MRKICLFLPVVLFAACDFLDFSDRGGEGDACFVNDTCTAPYQCVEGTCVLPAADNDAVGGVDGVDDELVVGEDDPFAGTDDELVVDDDGEEADEDTIATCGNGATDYGEACDGDAKNCTQINANYIDGWAPCKGDCSGYDTSACTVDTDADANPDDDATGCAYSHDGLCWSNHSANTMTQYEAITYCENLVEGGSSNWRLPTISELRTLITNCAVTETGGSCGVTDACLTSDCWASSCDGCTPYGKIYSAFGEASGSLWSSSVYADDSTKAWHVDFGNARVNDGVLRDGSNANPTNVRCVRDDSPTTDDDVVPDPDVQPDGDVPDDSVDDTVSLDNDVVPDDDVPDNPDVQPDDDVAPGPCGSVRFDGSTGYIEVLHNALLNLTGAWTIEAWVYQDTIPSQAPIVRKGGATTSPSYHLYGSYADPSNTEPYGGYYYEAANSYSRIAPNVPNAGEWYHIAIVKVTSPMAAMAIFINGVAGDSMGSISGDPYANTESLFFGSRRSAGPSYFEGLIDEIRISNVGRYIGSFTPPERFDSDANTIGLWHFEEGSGTTANDASGNGLNGSLVNGVSWESSCVANGLVTVPDDDVMPDDDVDNETPDQDVASGQIDTIGTSESSYTAGDRLKGNYFSCTVSRTVTEIQTYMAFTGGLDITYALYSSSTQTGTYSLVSQTTVSSSSAGTPGWYSSGNISWALASGSYYFIGIYFGQTDNGSYPDPTYYYATTLNTTQPIFGTHLGGGESATFTSPPSSVATIDNTYGYFMKVTTQ
ncbi:MAG TPA: DUF1566 domain-containing protein [bacterium]|nr:DUF1566 domain-containing protein [bacterium]